MPRYKPVEGTLTVDGYTFPYVFERKAVKNYNLRVRRDGSVHLSAPTRVTQAMAEKFLAEKVDFIKSAREKMARHHPQMPLTLADGEKLPIFGISHTVRLLNAKKSAAYCENGVLYLALSHPSDAAARVRLFWQFAKRETEALMRTLTAQYAPYLLEGDMPMPQIEMQRMKSRWGACFYTQNRIKYSTNLIFVPEGCAHYVACHELAHFKHHNHSADFHAYVARVMPQHKAWRKLLHEFPIPLLEIPDKEGLIT